MTRNAKFVIVEQRNGSTVADLGKAFARDEVGAVEVWKQTYIAQAAEAASKGNRLRAYPLLAESSLNPDKRVAGTPDS